MHHVSGGKKYASGVTRPLIGVMTGSFHTDYSRKITDAILNRLKSEGMDVCIFQGLDASRYLNIDGYVDKGFDRHYYSQFEYSRFIKPDLLIVSFGTISAVSEPRTLEEFRAILPDVPTVFLEIGEETRNSIYILADNYEGMCACVEHLAKDHGYKRIFYVSGPRGVADAELRLKAYTDTMRRCGLDTENTVFYGDFTDRVDGIIESILNLCERPDAIVCGNDEMAESAYRVLSEHGLRVGRDVAVTGFDDNYAARLMEPPLTSVRQSKEDIADKILEVTKAFLNGGSPVSATLPARLCVRESCGCRFPKEGESADDHMEHVPWETAARAESQAMRDRKKIKKLSNEMILTSIMLRNLLSQHVTVHSFFKRLGNVLGKLGAEHSWIALLEKPMTVKDASKHRLPDRLRLHMVQDGDEVCAWSRKDAPLIRADGDSDNVFLERGSTDKRIDAVFPLFYGSDHYGVFVVRLTLDDMLGFYTVSLQIGTGLKYLFMALDEQEARAALEEKNQILDFSASHDNLTGLYNRVGVANHVYDFIRAKGQRGRYVAVMADLDHLKQINDTFGHSMGDHAIKKAAEILRSILPTGAPIGRSGGDEFMAVFAAETDDAAKRFSERVKNACREYNDLNEVPFYEEISVGCWLFEMERGTDIPSMFTKADEQLYINKKKRRESVIR